jgi:hypothetical protein
LYAQQVAELNASKDLKKVRNYYEGLYEDPKNKDLKDVVIFERALFEEKQNDIPLTLELLHQAAKETGSIPRLKGYIYQKLADIKFNQFKDYRATKYYLDSALTFIKEEDPVAKQLTEKKTSLDTYVFHFVSFMVVCVCCLIFPLLFAQPDPTIYLLSFFLRSIKGDNPFSIRLVTHYIFFPITFMLLLTL